MTILPLDLTATIFDLQELPDAVALSLACKGLHQHLFPAARRRFEGATAGARREVQTMLEKDLPEDQIYCAFCKTFHTLDDEYRKTKCLEGANPALASFGTHVAGKRVLTLKYLDARALVNATLFKRSPAADLLKKLEWNVGAGLPRMHPCRKATRAEYGASPWFQEGWAKVIKGQLFLHVEAVHHELAGIRDRDEVAYSVCKHVALRGRFPHLWANTSELRRVCHFSSRDQVTGTCETCRADWNLKQTWTPSDDGTKARAGWLIHVTSWHYLGWVRSPFESWWSDSAGEVAKPEIGWVEGDSVYINDHDDWDHQMQACTAADPEMAFGTLQRIWWRDERKDKNQDEERAEKRAEKQAGQQGGQQGGQQSGQQGGQQAGQQGQQQAGGNRNQLYYKVSEG